MDKENELKVNENGNPVNNKPLNGRN